MNGFSVLLAKDMFFGKQKLYVKKINKFIKYIWQLIISNSNATLEIPWLRPWYKYWYIEKGLCDIVQPSECTKSFFALVIILTN